MVVLFNLTIKTIRGEEFTIQTDRDADTLGLKVQIWELRNVAVEGQRLVFAGRELQDSMKLASAGVGDGATIFMVEAAGQDAAPPAFSQPAPQNPVVMAAPVMLPLVQQDSQRVIVNIPVQQINGGRQVVGYEPLSQEVLAEERMNATYDLARWIRKYTLFSGFILVVGAAMCPYGAHMLPLILMTLIGWMGTRNLCICNVGVYCLYMFVISCLMVFGPIHCIRKDIRSHNHHAVWLLCLLIFVGALHFCIFASIVKLIRNVRSMVGDERKQVRARIAEHRTLC